MKIAGLISAAIGLAVAVGAGLSLLIAPSAVALCLLLLGLLLFFIAAGAARRRGPAPITAQPLTMPSAAPTRREPDSAKLRRSAAKLGVDLPPETSKPAALNEDAAKEALRDILGKRATQ